MKTFLRRKRTFLHFYFIGCVFCLLALSAPHSYGQTQTENIASQKENAKDLSGNLIRITIGSDTYLKNKIIQDFLNVTFSDAIWLEETIKPWQPIDTFTSYLKSQSDINKQKKVPYRLLSEFIHRPEGLPRHNAIMKWAGEISIGLDWPPLEDWSMQERYGYPEKKQEAYDRFAKHIQTLVPDIQQLTGLQTTFYPRSELTDLKEDFARIRIIPIESTHFINYFRTDKYFLPFSGSMNRFQIQYLGAVPFTPKSPQSGRWRNIA